MCFPSAAHHEHHTMNFGRDQAAVQEKTDICTPLKRTELMGFKAKSVPKRLEAQPCHPDRARAGCSLSPREIRPLTFTTRCISKLGDATPKTAQLSEGLVIFQALSHQWEHHHPGAPPRISPFPSDCPDHCTITCFSKEFSLTFWLKRSSLRGKTGGGSLCSHTTKQ